jgi:hypothetical protein
MARHKNVDWNLPGPNVETWEQAQVAVLMDIRDELKALNATLACYRVRRMCDDINRIERRIAKNMPLRKPKKG